jgi:hypothetical protein
MKRLQPVMRYARPFALTLLAAPLPLLFFLTNGANLAEIAPSDGLKLLLVVIVTALAILFLCRPLVKDWERAGIVAGLGSYFVFNFMAFYDQYRDIVPRLAAHNSLTIVLWLAVAVLLIFGLRRLSDHRVRLLASYLLTVAAVLFLFKTYSVAAFAFGSSGSRLTVANVDIDEAAPTTPATTKPDVYYIVLDRYTGPIGLKAAFRFDNSRYLNSLRKRGFYVAERSYGNYPGTLESLPSSLNASYYRAKPNPSKQSDATYYRKALVQRMQNPAVPRFFKRQGYEYIQIASWWGVTQRSRVAERIYIYDYRTIVAMGKQFNLSDAEDKFVGWTLLAKLLKTDLHIGDFKILGWQTAAPRSRKRSASVFLRQVNDIERLASEKSSRPKFVFAHTLMPHGPYVFDADGGPLPAGITNNERYVRQLQFTNREVLKLVDRLLAIYGKKPPVIMLVSDEGEHPAHYSVEASDSKFQEKYNISGAYYFPGIEHTGLYQTITPVNYFRVLMNDYFHTNLALLPDRNFTSVNGAIDITGRLRHPQVAKSVSPRARFK